MTTFLEGVVDLAEECDLASAPSSVVSQTGESKKLVKWYKDAYIEIQNRSDWRWLRHSFTVNTVASDDTYASSECTDTTTSSAISRFSKWRLADTRDPPKIYLNSAGIGTERWLIYSPWEYFKTVYKIGSQLSNTGAPAHISFDPANQLVVGPIPNGVYVVTGDYIRSPQVLAENTDTPEMPSQFHKLIVYRAMQKYGYHESAPEVIERGRFEERRMMRQLEDNQLDPIGMARPMA